MIRIVVIGTGNVGLHLCSVFENNTGQKLPDTEIESAKEASKSTSTQSRITELVGYYNSSGTALKNITAPLLSKLDKLPQCDLILLAVPDDQIASTASVLPKTQAIVAHTSGSVAIAALSTHRRYGVFYLPQTFSRERAVDFKNINLCLEASNPDVMQVLQRVAGTLSRKQTILNSQQRRQLHLAAVYVNNFTNHCYNKAQEIMNAADMPANLLDALMEETLQKAKALGAEAAQTGPARRGDMSTINAHLKLLPKEDKEMYLSITKSIQKTHGNKL